MLQAAVLDSQFLDLVPLSDDGFVAPKIDVSGCDVVQALVVAFVVIVIHERPNLAAHPVGFIMRRTCGDASAGFRVFCV